MTEAQEVGYIHSLLPRLLAPDNSILVTEDLPKSGFSSKESSALIARLEADDLAKRGYATTLVLTPLGRQVARDPRGYTAHLRRQRRQALVKEIRDWLGAYGSLIGGLAGMVGAGVAFISLVDSRKTAGEMDNMRSQLRELTHTQASIATRLSLLEQQRALATQKSTTLTKYSAAAPSSATTNTKPAPAPASAPMR